MRRTVVVVATLSVVMLGTASTMAQKGKGRPARPALAVFNGDGWITGTIAGVLDGAFIADLSRTSDTVCFGLDFSDPLLAGEGTPPLTADGNCYEATLVNVHGVSSLPLDDYGARQMGVSFTDARGYAYTLQFGDAYETPPDYARGTCLAQTSGSCTTASVDSTPGTYLGQSGEPRTTGPAARLTVQVGRKKPALVGFYNVPFQMSISVQ